MFKLACVLPQNNVAISYSGGVDSEVMRHFISTSPKRPPVKLVHFHHNTRMANVFLQHVRLTAMTFGHPLEVHYINGKNEQEWRQARYDVLSQMSETIITCHHHDDNEETMLMRHRPIPLVNGNIIRPFLITTKRKIYDYAKHHNLNWIEDPTNLMLDCKRNQIRQQFIPLARHIGIALPIYEKNN